MHVTSQLQAMWYGCSIDCSVHFFRKRLTYFDNNMKILFCLIRLSAAFQVIGYYALLYSCIFKNSFVDNKALNFYKVSKWLPLQF